MGDTARPKKPVKRPRPPVFPASVVHPPTHCRQSSRPHGSCMAGPCVLAGPALARTPCVAPHMPSHNVFLCLVALHAHKAAQSATKHKAHYATLLTRSVLLVLWGSLAPIYCSAGNRPNTDLCGSLSGGKTAKRLSEESLVLIGRM